jgi:short-subunit dehydrogenase
MERNLVGTAVGVSVLCPGPTDTSIYRASPGMSTDVQRHIASRRENVGGSLLDSSMVGQAVIDAVRDHRFYIFTHPQYRDSVAARFTRILDAFDEAAARTATTA